MDDVDPRVREILRSARQRSTPEGRVSVDPRDLSGALEEARMDGRDPVIAEVKPTSPTSDYEKEQDLVHAAEKMVEGGAAAISVLTEPDHFNGSARLLRGVRDAVDVPVLRKDFILEPSQLDRVEADMVLLIARFVDDLGEMVREARDRGFQPLVEVHTEQELELALETDAEVLGINNRDLSELEVDLGTVERLAPKASGDLTLVAESGLKTREDVERMMGSGADACLIGSAIMSGDITEKTSELAGGSPDGS